MTLFLDTCIFVHSSTSFDAEYHKKAVQIVRLGDYATSKIVYDELKRIRQRREEIYSKVLSYDHEKYLGKTVQDFYNSCFKSSLGSNKNDEIHLKRLFEHCMNAAGIKYAHILKKDALDLFIMELYPKINDIRVAMRRIVSDLTSPQYYKDHVVAEYHESPHYKELKKSLFDLPEANKHKEDLKIITDAIAYSESETKKTTFISTDSIYKTYEKDITEIVKRIHPTAQIEIKHLKDH